MTSCPRRFIHLSLDFFWGRHRNSGLPSDFVCETLLGSSGNWQFFYLQWWGQLFCFFRLNYQFFGLQDLANDKPLWKKTEGDVWIYANKWRGSNRFLDRGKRGWTTKYSQYSISIAKILPVDDSPQKVQEDILQIAKSLVEIGCQTRRYVHQNAAFAIVWHVKVAARLQGPKRIRPSQKDPVFKKKRGLKGP